MPTFRWILIVAIVTWGVWALSLGIRRSWDVEDLELPELVGYVIYVLVMIVITGLLVKWIGSW